MTSEVTWFDVGWTRASLLHGAPKGNNCTFSTWDRLFRELVAFTGHVVITVVIFFKEIVYGLLRKGKKLRLKKKECFSK